MGGYRWWRKRFRKLFGIPQESSLWEDYRTGTKEIIRVRKQRDELLAACEAALWEVPEEEIHLQLKNAIHNAKESQP